MLVRSDAVEIARLRGELAVTRQRVIGMAMELEQEREARREQTGAARSARDEAQDSKLEAARAKDAQGQLRRRLADASVLEQDLRNQIDAEVARATEDAREAAERRARAEADWEVRLERDLAEQQAAAEGAAQEQQE